MEIGAFLSSEEQGPRELVAIARRAEAAGMRSALISDHFHPWLDAQGESPFVWSVIGGIATTTSLRVTTGVTCPTVRLHPAIIAQAAATCSAMLNGRFRLGVGSGENLNEHILGDAWPPVSVRLEMLEEAVEVIRKLWTGKMVTHEGEHYTVHNARIFTTPPKPIPVLVSAFGPKAMSVASRIGDGFVTTTPDGDAIRSYRNEGGKGPATAALKVCWARSESTARKTAHHFWATSGLPGQLSQELPLPEHFEQATELVSEEAIGSKMACGPDPERHLAAIRAYEEAGIDELYISQIGPDQEGFFTFFERELAPRLQPVGAGVSG